MVSILCNVFDDWGMSIKNGLGEKWLLILAIAFACIALFMLYSVAISSLKKSIRKNKFVFKWVQLFFMIVFAFFSIWFLTLL